jgi:hypothetical protein
MSMAASDRAASQRRLRQGVFYPAAFAFPYKFSLIHHKIKELDGLIIVDTGDSPQGAIIDKGLHL